VDAISLRVTYLLPIIVENEGNHETPLKLYVITPILPESRKIIITNQTTEQKLSLNVPIGYEPWFIEVLTASHTIIASYIKSSVEYFNQNVYSWLDFDESEWFDAPPGVTDLTFNCTVERVEALYRSAWV
jgi:hypothetical protein